MSVPPEPINDFVKQKIKAHINKTGRKNSRARAWGSLGKVIKKAASIAELLTEDDQEENLWVIRQAKRATTRMWNIKTKKMEEFPDHKTRLAAVMLDLAYREGKPVERQISANGSLTDMKELLARLDTSPSYQESLQKEVDCKEVTLALPAHDTETG